MMPVRRLRPVCIVLTPLALCGIIAAGSTTAQTMQTPPFWHKFIHRFTSRPEAASLTQISAQRPETKDHDQTFAPLTTASDVTGTKNGNTSPQQKVNASPDPASPFAPASAFTTEDKQAELTLSTALTFMLPRLLTPHTPQELCLWGMQALLNMLEQPHDRSPSSAQAGFTFTFHPASLFSAAHLTILYDGRTLLSEKTPDKDDLSGWSHLSARLIALLHQDIPHFQIMSDDALLSHFLNGMLARLDPYSRYLPPPPPPSHSDSLSQSSTPATQFPSISVGLTLRRTHAHFPLVSALNLNSPLWDAGITPGDSLVSLDGHSTRHVSLDTLQDMLAGPAGSTVRLEFRTQDGHHIERPFIRSQMAEESVFPDHAGPYPILRVTHFSAHTAEEVSQYLSTLLPDTPPDADITHPPTSRTTPPPSLPGLVLDLRGNHGGILQQAVMTAALFLDHGVIATTEGRAPESNHVWSIQGGDLTNNTPLALLVDKDTGSAAEVLAAALADQQRAVVTGSSSFGKGMVQISAIMPNGGHLSLTWARITAPQGWALQGLGVLPQLCTTPRSQFSIRSQLTALRDGHSLMANTLQKSRLIHEDSTDSARLALRNVCPPSPPGPSDLSAALALFIVPHAYHTALLHLPGPSSTDMPSPAPTH